MHEDTPTVPIYLTYITHTDRSILHQLLALTW